MIWFLDYGTLKFLTATQTTEAVRVIIILTSRCRCSCGHDDFGMQDDTDNMDRNRRYPVLILMMMLLLMMMMRRSSMMILKLFIATALTVGSYVLGLNVKVCFPSFASSSRLIMIVSHLSSSHRSTILMGTLLRRSLLTGS